MKAVYQAPPLLCVPKKNGRLRTVVDARKRNENTFKDVTPFPDQDQIRMDVARAKYRTKIDMLRVPNLLGFRYFTAIFYVIWFLSHSMLSSRGNTFVAVRTYICMICR